MLIQYTSLDIKIYTKRHKGCPLIKESLLFNAARSHIIEEEQRTPNRKQVCLLMS